MVPRVDFISAPGVSPSNVYRPGGPYKMVTGLGLFAFDRTLCRFRLESVHPGHSVRDIVDNTGFDFDCPAHVPQTPAPEAEVLQLLRGRVRGEIADAYPRFAASLAS
ncbi:MAG TPA: CoA synthetase, partial [Burkholderiales bacterium]|nr:CoA synthetase [Burkholderiales bacterium]